MEFYAIRLILRNSKGNEVLFAYKDVIICLPWIVRVYRERDAL